MTDRHQRQSLCTCRDHGRRAAWAGAVAGFLALTAVAAQATAGDSTLGVKPWLPSNGPPQSRTLELQRTDVYRDRLNAETRSFELQGERGSYRAMDRNRSFQRERGRLNRVAPLGVRRPVFRGAPQAGTK